MNEELFINMPKKKLLFNPDNNLWNVKFVNRRGKVIEEKLMEYEKIPKLGSVWISWPSHISPRKSYLIIKVEKGIDYTCTITVEEATNKKL